MISAKPLLQSRALKLVKETICAERYHSLNLITDFDKENLFARQLTAWITRGFIISCISIPHEILIHNYSAIVTRFSAKIQFRTNSENIRENISTDDDNHTISCHEEATLHLSISLFFHVGAEADLYRGL